MTPREPEEVNRSLKRWLWQEEQRWKRARHAEADWKKVVIKANRDRDRLTPEDRKAAAELAAAANADAWSLTIASKSARLAREMLGLDWPDVAKLAGVLPSLVIAFESSGRSNVIERKRLQTFYEGEGLVFDRDGGVKWAE